MNTPKYRRVLVKISGEALAGEAGRGLDFSVIGPVCDVLKQCVEAGVQVAVVVGGGNIWRGLKDGGSRMERTRADQMGMLATVINALGLADALEQRGCPARVPPGEGPRGHLWLRHRQPLFLHRHGCGAARH